MTEQSEKPLDQAAIRARQRSRAIVMGVILGGLVVLFYAIAIVKITGGGQG